MTKVLLSRIGCRYTCNFCHPLKPYENPQYSQERNLNTFKDEVDSTPQECNTFTIGGVDCNEDLDLLFKIISYIREKRKFATNIQIESHCAELQNPAIVEKLKGLGVRRIILPIYGSTPEIHHTIMTPKETTKVIGFPQIEAINNSLKANINVSVHTVITATNKNDLINVVDLLFKTAKKNNTQINYKIRPVYLTRGRSENYIPIKDLAFYLSRVQSHLINLNKEKKFLNYGFIGFPFCLFDVFEINIENSDFTEKLLKEYTLYVGEQLPISKENYSSVDPRIPDYRMRTHATICEKCKIKEFCAGFQKNDYEIFGTGNLQPLQ